MLLAQIVGARPEALGALYDRYGRLVFGLAIKITGDADLAVEITQDVFFQVWEKAASYHPEQGKVLTWLASIAHHRAVDVLRRRNTRPEGHQTEVDDEFLYNIGDGVQVEFDLEKKETSEQVRLALGELPVEQRQVIILAYFKGLSQQEIADRLGEPLGTVKTRVRLGMIKLRQALTDLVGR